MFARVLSLLMFAGFASAETITGTVRFTGDAPVHAAVDRSADPKCTQDRPDDAVVVTRGNVRDVLVRVIGVTGAAPKDPVVLDQKDCTYTPRVVGLVAGQKLLVHNSDDTFHNVHGSIRGKLLWNKPQSPGAAPLALEAGAKPGDIIDIVCDVHGWMRAYAVVTESPYFAVTTDAGSFEIRGVPPGRYTLEAWHAVLGTKTQTVEVTTKPAAVRFVFEAPGPTPR